MTEEDNEDNYIYAICTRCGWQSNRYDSDTLLSVIHALMPKTCPKCGYDTALRFEIPGVYHVEGTFHYTVKSRSTNEAPDEPFDMNKAAINVTHCWKARE